MKTKLKSLNEKNKKESLIQVRIDKDSKLELEGILEILGLSTSQLFQILIKQVILKKKIPFEININQDEIDYNDLSQKDFMKMQSYYLSLLDKDETIPEFHEKNARPFVPKPFKPKKY
jgi:addiction module RelB/DinJ family antitoxin